MFRVSVTVVTAAAVAGATLNRIVSSDGGKPSFFGAVLAVVKVSVLDSSTDETVGLIETLMLVAPEEKEEEVEMVTNASEDEVAMAVVASEEGVVTVAMAVIELGCISTVGSVASSFTA
jgi:hypothetical protein